MLDRVRLKEALAAVTQVDDAARPQAARLPADIRRHETVPVSHARASTNADLGRPVSTRLLPRQ